VLDQGRRHVVQGGTRECGAIAGGWHHKGPPGLHRLLRCHTHSRHGNAAVLQGRAKCDETWRLADGLFVDEVRRHLHLGGAREDR
jgi:hypothetical protein